MILLQKLMGHIIADYFAVEKDTGYSIKVLIIFSFVIISQPIY